MKELIFPMIVGMGIIIFILSYWNERKNFVEIIVAGFIFFIIILSVASFGYNLIDNTEKFSNNIYSFCPDEKRSIQSGVFATTHYFCEGKEFTCNSEKCFYVTEVKK